MASSASAAICQRSASFIKLPLVKIVPAAIASALGLRTFCLANRSRSANHLVGYGTDQAGGQREEQVVAWLETVPLTG